jgi:magnesium transporter
MWWREIGNYNASLLKLEHIRLFGYLQRLKVLVERVLEELTSDVNMGGLQRLLPLKRALTELEHDIRDAHNAMEQVLNSDENLQALCLQARTTPWLGALTSSSIEGKEGAISLRQAASDMLLTYQREFDDAGGALEELRKDLNAAQEIWELGLDTTRNRIIRTDLMMSMGTLSVSLAAAVGAFFGMNLQSGFEDHPTLFYWVSGCATATSVIFAAVLFNFVRIRPRIEDKRRAEDLAGLQNLLQHLDDLDDIFQVVITEVAGKPVTRKEFLRIVRQHPFADHMTQSELDLMFRLFDVNRNRVLELKEFHMQQSR